MTTRRARVPTTDDVFHAHDIAQRIMDHLPPLDAANFACTNKLLAKLLHDAAGKWTKMKFTQRPIPSVQCLQNMVPLTGNVREICLECGWFTRGSRVMRVLQQLSQLQELRLDHPGYNDVHGVGEISTLRVLKLYECQEFETQQSAAILRGVAWLALKSLAFTLRGTYIENNVWMHIEHCCDNISATLQELEVGPVASKLVSSWVSHGLDGMNTRQLRLPALNRLTMEVSTINEHTLGRLIDVFRDLDELSLRDHTPRTKTDLTDDGMQWLAARVRLRKLALVRSNGKFSASDIGAMYLITASSDILEQVTISGIPKLSDVTITTLLKCPQLRQMHVQGCQNVGGHAFSRDVLGIHQLPSMVSVNLSHCSSIGDESIMALCELCPNLTELNLTDTSAADDAMISIAQLRVLKQLVLNGCHITDQGIEQFVSTVKQTNRTTTITKLALRGCRAISDSGILSLNEAPVISSIVCLDVTGVVQLTDEGLLPLVQTAMCLDQLKLRGCTRLTSRILNAIATGAMRRRLTLLDICHCEGMGAKQDVKGIAAILRILAHVDEYPRLQRLYLGCSGLKRDGMFAAMKTFTELHCDRTLPRTYQYAQVLVYHFDDEVSSWFHEQAAAAPMTELALADHNEYLLNDEY